MDLSFLINNEENNNNNSPETSIPEKVKENTSQDWIFSIKKNTTTHSSPSLNEIGSLRPENSNIPTINLVEEKKSPNTASEIFIGTQETISNQFLPSDSNFLQKVN